MARKISSLVFVAAIAMLSACESGPLRADNPQMVASPDRVSLMLAEAADKAANSLETLAAVEQARTPQVSLAPITDAPPELRRAITVNWVGAAEPITKTLANRAGYVFQTVGSAPPVPLVVSIDVENKPVIEVLRSIGLQLGNRANVQVDSSRRMIEIRYAPVTGAGK